jgi:hypothetical protein
VPTCPRCGKPLTTNLRSDDKFVEDEGWHVHADYYSEFLRRHQNTKTLFLELGVGHNTPVFYSLRTTQKVSNCLKKQRISEHLHDRQEEYEERRCA